MQPCCMSMHSQSSPVWAMTSACTQCGIESQPPTVGLPSRQRFFVRFPRMFSGPLWFVTDQNVLDGIRGESDCKKLPPVAAAPAADGGRRECRQWYEQGGAQLDRLHEQSCLLFFRAPARPYQVGLIEPPIIGAKL